MWKSRMSHWFLCFSSCFRKAAAAAAFGQLSCGVEHSSSRWTGFKNHQEARKFRGCEIHLNIIQIQMIKKCVMMVFTVACLTYCSPLCDHHHSPPSQSPSPGGLPMLLNMIYHAFSSVSWCWLRGETGDEGPCITCPPKALAAAAAKAWYLRLNSQVSSGKEGKTWKNTAGFSWMLCFAPNFQLRPRMAAAEEQIVSARVSSQPEPTVKWTLAPLGCWDVRVMWPANS